MDASGPGSYGDAFAAVYDDWYPGGTDLDTCVDVLAGLAGEGPALELGVGTGRVASALRRRRVWVIGLDTSPAMLDRARGRDQQLPLLRADMASLPLAAGARLSLVFASANTLFNLPTTEGQGRCIDQAARRLAPGGYLVTEGLVPSADLAATPSSVGVSRIGVEVAVLSAVRHDAAASALLGQHVELGGPGIRLRPWQVHYQPLDTLDRLAGAAGLGLMARWCSWTGEPYESSSETAISLWRRR